MQSPGRKTKDWDRRRASNGDGGGRDTSLGNPQMTARTSVRRLPVGGQQGRRVAEYAGAPAGSEGRSLAFLGRTRVGKLALEPQCPPSSGTENTQSLRPGTRCRGLHPRESPLLQRPCGDTRNDQSIEAGPGKTKSTQGDASGRLREQLLASLLSSDNRAAQGHPTT